MNPSRVGLEESVHEVQSLLFTLGEQLGPLGRCRRLGRLLMRRHVEQVTDPARQPSRWARPVEQGRDDRVHVHGRVSTQEELAEALHTAIYPVGG